MNLFFSPWDDQGYKQIEEVDVKELDWVQLITPWCTPKFGIKGEVKVTKTPPKEHWTILWAPWKKGVKVIVMYTRDHWPKSHFSWCPLHLWYKYIAFCDQKNNYVSISHDALHVKRNQNGSQLNFPSQFTLISCQFLPQSGFVYFNDS